MTLGEWEIYHAKALARVREHIAERGRDAIGNELYDEDGMANEAVESVQLSNGYRIECADNDWHLILPDGTPQMNQLDGKTPYFHGCLSNALFAFCTEFKGMRKEDCVERQQPL